MNRAIALSLLTAAVLGAVIWAISPAVTGAAEPWDAESPYYFASLFVAGALVGVLFPRHIWAVLPGMVVGQLIYMFIFLASGPLLPVGVLFLFGYGLLALLGASLASRIKHRPERLNSEDGHVG